MAKPASIQIKLVSTAETGFYYVTKKNPRNHPEKQNQPKKQIIPKKIIPKNIIQNKSSQKYIPKTLFQKKYKTWTSTMFLCLHH